MPYKNYPQSATNAAKKALKHKEEVSVDPPPPPPNADEAV